MLLLVKLSVLSIGIIVYILNGGCQDQISKCLTRVGEIIMFWSVYWMLIG